MVFHRKWRSHTSANSSDTCVNIWANTQNIINIDWQLLKGSCCIWDKRFSRVNTPQNQTNAFSAKTQMSLPVAARVLPLLGAVCLLIVLALTFSPSSFQPPSSSIGLTSPPYFAPWLEQNILDGCHHVYLDMGTNMWDLKQKGRLGTWVALACCLRCCF